MPVPDFLSVMLPLLDSLNDGQTHRVTELAEAIADTFDLTETELAELLPSGQRRFLNRVGWARSNT